MFSHTSMRSLNISNKIISFTNILNKKKSVQNMRVFSSLSSSDEKYPGHIPTNSFQKVLLSLGSSALTLFNPARGGK